MGNVNHRYCGWWVLMPIARAEQGATVRLSGRSCPSVPLPSFLAFFGRVGVWLGLGLEVMVLGAGAVQDVVWCDTA